MLDRPRDTTTSEFGALLRSLWCALRGGHRWMWLADDISARKCMRCPRFKKGVR